MISRSSGEAAEDAEGAKKPTVHWLREGLEQELLGASALARRVPRPTIAAAPPGLAALTGIGASFIVGSVAMLLLDPYWVSLGAPPPIRLFELDSLVGAIAGGATALAAGGRRGLLAYAGYVLAIAATTLVRDWARAPSDIRPLETVVSLMSEWPRAIGIPIGVALGGLVRRKARAPNPLLEGAGTFALVGALLYLPLGAVVFASGTAIAFAYASSVPIAAAQAFAAALVLARRSARPAVSAALLAFVVVAGPAPLTISQLEMAFRYGALDSVPLLLLPLATAALVFAGTLGWQRALTSRR